MCTPLSCSSRALVLPRMNHSSSSSTPAGMHTQAAAVSDRHQRCRCARYLSLGQCRHIIVSEQVPNQSVPL
jgi:hypothetical protein